MSDAVLQDSTELRRLVGPDDNRLRSRLTEISGSWQRFQQGNCGKTHAVNVWNTVRL